MFVRMFVNDMITLSLTVLVSTAVCTSVADSIVAITLVSIAVAEILVISENKPVIVSNKLVVVEIVKKFELNSVSTWVNVNPIVSKATLVDSSVVVVDSVTVSVVVDVSVRVVVMTADSIVVNTDVRRFVFVNSIDVTSVVSDKPTKVDVTVSISELVNVFKSF